MMKNISVGDIMEEKYISQYKIRADDLLKKLKIDTNKYALKSISTGLFSNDVTINLKQKVIR